MKMQTLILFCALSSLVYGQEVSATLSEAKSAYSSGNLDDARFALEQSLQQIDQAIGKEILDILPSTLSGISYQEADDNVVGTNMGFAGLFVHRNYGDTAKNVNIEIIGDSPLMAGLNAILAMPAIMTGGNDGQKRIKVDGYKSLIQKDADDEYTIQIPASNTLISIDCDGFNENEVIAIANNIPVSGIVKLAQ